jgi:hypothetical protein
VVVLLVDVCDEGLLLEQLFAGRTTPEAALARFSSPQSKGRRQGSSS